MNFDAEHLESQIVNYDFLIVTTGWESELEKKALKLAIDMDVESIVLLDHWTNFNERFLYRGSLLSPNQIVVFDSYAKEIAEKVTPNTKFQF